MSVVQALKQPSTLQANLIAVSTNLQKKSFDNIDSYWMDYNEFVQLEEVFCQRNTEARLAKSKRHLSKLLPEHLSVAVCKLTKDCKFEGVEYKAGQKFRVDSNTRALNWQLGNSDYIPEKLLVTEYSFDSLDRIRECYNTFDSPDATERNQEKFFGILSGMYRFTPNSDKLKRGAIITGLNRACTFIYPEHWNQQSVKTSELPGQIGAFLEEIKYLDDIFKSSSSWDQALVCSALMATKKYGINNKKLEEIFRDIDDRAGDTRGREWDGATHITEEWKTDKFLGEKGTSYDNMNRSVSFILYWIDKYMSDTKGTKAGRGWDQVAKEYKNSFTAKLF